MPEVTGDAALLLDEPTESALADALRTVLGSPATAARHRALGLLRATEFSWTRAAAAVEGAYLRALGRHAPV